MKKLIFTLITLLSAFASQAQNCNILNVTWAHTPQPGAPYLVTFTNNTPTANPANQYNFQLVYYSPSYQIDPFWGSQAFKNYPGPGTYDVGAVLNVYDSVNNQFICHDSLHLVITLNAVPCVSTIAVANNGGGAYTFTANNVGGGSGTTYSWDFGDGSMSGSGSPATHTYANSGTYYVTLTSQSGGVTCQTSTTVNYFSGSLNCSQYSADYSYFAYSTHDATFSNYSTYANVPNIVETALWDFGDGTTSTQYSPYHIFPAYGTYTVTLQTQWVDSITQQVYCSDTYSQNITFSIPANEITGNIGWDSSLNVAQTSFKVWLITFDSATNIIDAIDSVTVSGFNGAVNYAFNNVNPGDYRTKAAVLSGAPGANLMAPTYSFASTYWGNANIIWHNGQNSNNNYIYMQSGSSANGPGFISGNVTQGAGKGTGAGVPGLLVLLRDAGNNMERFTYTDINGDYSFGNLGDGTYNIYPENMPQVTTPSATITVASGSYSVSGIDFEKTSTTIKPKATSVENLPAEDIFAIYPNPTDGAVNLNWNSNVTGKVSIKVMDITGREVYNATANTNTTAHINMNAAPAGVYFINVVSDKAQHTQKLIIQ